MAYKVNTLFTVTYDNLKNAITNIKSQFKSVEQSAESVKQKVSNTFSTANRDIKNVNDSIKESSELIDKGLKTSALGIATITTPVLLAGKNALKMAGQYDSATQTLEYTLGDAKRIVDDFVENNSQAIGMAEQDAYKFANIYSNLLTTMTNNQTTNAEYTNKLMQASAVIMSKTGRTFSDVADRIRSGLLGNTEAIEDLGVNVNVALLETTDAFKQIANGRTWDNLTFQEQQQVRLLGILEQTSKKYGEEVGNNLSLKLARTSANFENIKTEASQFLATGLQPMLAGINSALSGIMVFIKYLNTLDDGTKQTIATFIVIVAIIPIVALAFFTLIKAINSYIVFTKVASSSTVMLTKRMVGLLGTILLLVAGIAMIAYSLGAFNNTGKNINKTTQNTTSASKALDGLSASQNSNAESAKKASKANKELADNLQGFDEINKLNLDSGSSGLDDSIGPVIDLSGIDIGAFDNISDQFSGLTEKVESFKNKMEELKPIIGVIGLLLTGFGILRLVGKVSGLIDKLGTLGGWILKIGTFLSEHLAVLGGIVLILGALKTGYNSIKKLIDNDLTGSFIDFLKTIGLVVAGVGLIAGLIPGLIVGIVVAVAYGITVLVTKWDAFCVGLQYIWERATGELYYIFYSTISWIIGKVEFFQNFWENMCLFVSNYFNNACTSVKNSFSNVGNSLDNVTNVIKNKVISIVNWLKNNFKIPDLKAPNMPYIKTPHFTVSYNSDGWGSKIFQAMGMEGTPSVSVNWYKSGGIFTGASVIGVGEYPNAKLNPEIVTPQSLMYDTIVQANQDTSRSSYINNSPNKSISKKVELELDFKSAGVKLGKQIIELILDANDFYDLDLI